MRKAFIDSCEHGVVDQTLVSSVDQPTRELGAMLALQRVIKTFPPGMVTSSLLSEALSTSTPGSAVQNTHTAGRTSHANRLYDKLAFDEEYEHTGKKHRLDNQLSIQMSDLLKAMETLRGTLSPDLLAAHDVKYAALKERFSQLENTAYINQEILSDIRMLQREEVYDQQSRLYQITSELSLLRIQLNELEELSKTDAIIDKINITRVKITAAVKLSNRLQPGDMTLADVRNKIRSFSNTLTELRKTRMNLSPLRRRAKYNVVSGNSATISKAKATLDGITIKFLAIESQTDEIWGQIRDLRKEDVSVVKFLQMLYRMEHPV